MEPNQKLKKYSQEGRANHSDIVKFKEVDPNMFFHNLCQKDLKVKITTDLREIPNQPEIQKLERLSLNVVPQ